MTYLVGRERGEKYSHVSHDGKTRHIEGGGCEKGMEWKEKKHAFPHWEIGWRVIGTVQVTAIAAESGYNSLVLSLNSTIVE